MKSKIIWVELGCVGGLGAFGWDKLMCLSNHP